MNTKIWCQNCILDFFLQTDDNVLMTTIPSHVAIGQPKHRDENLRCMGCCRRDRWARRCPLTFPSRISDILYTVRQSAKSAKCKKTISLKRLSINLNRLIDSMDTTESMVGDLDTWIPDTWLGTHRGWKAHIHGGEPADIVAWPALVGGQVGGHQICPSES